MKVLVQRVTRGSVAVSGETIGSVKQGFVALVGVTHGDTPNDAATLAAKTCKLRVFEDGDGKMNLALGDVDGGVLAISQFTLYGNTRKGNRPSFVDAAAPEQAREVYEHYVERLRAELGPERVATGRFGAMMHVEIHNDGPVTLELSTEPGRN